MTDGEGLDSRLGEESLDGVLRAFFGGEPGNGATSVLERIGRLAGERPAVLLRDGPDEPAPLVRTPAREGPEAVADDPRYQVLGEIARGGVGIVYKARDRDIGRDVVLKVLRPEHAENADVVRRFVEEAQVAGQLQHPGVVPVHGLSLQPDGRPCFAMKLVKGRTLAARLHARADPAEDRAAYLAVFERIAQTMAYAHSRGVIHRDLKPSNVMTGAHGQVLVLDWGFAKVLGRDRPAREPGPQTTIIATVRSAAEGSQSLAGSVMGTPAYMPPEQARGRVEELDRRSDVFALGAMLCEILTGRPPYDGAPEDLLVMAAQARQEDARQRLDACGADPGVVDLAGRCLEPDPDDRPADAAAVAGAVHRYLEDTEERARRASIDAAAERARREEENARLAAERLRVEKHRAREAEQRSEAETQRREEAKAERRLRAERNRRRAGLAVAATLALAAVLGALGWARGAREDAARTREVEDRVSRALVEAEGLAGDGKWGPAAEAARAAVELAKDAAPEVRSRAADLAARVEKGRRRDEEKRAAEERDREMVARLEAARLARIGGPSEQPDGTVRSSFWNNRRSHEAFADAIRWYGLDPETMPVEEAAKRIRASGIREELLAALDDWTWLLCAKSELSSERPDRLVAIADLADGDAFRREVRGAIVARDPERLADLGERALEQGATARTLDLLGAGISEQDRESRRARDVAFRLREAAHRLAPDDVWCLHHLAMELEDRGRGEEALPLREALVALRPECAGFWVSLGGALWRCGEIDRAKIACRRALELDFENVSARMTLGAVYAAEENYEKAIELCQEARERAPGVVEPLLNLVTYHGRTGRKDEALELARQAVRIDPESGDARDTLGWYLRESGALEEALPHALKATRLMPWHLGARVHLARVYHELGRIDDAVETMRRMVELEPENVYGHAWYAQALKWANRLDDAEAEIEKALELEPENFVALNEEVGIHLARGDPQRAVGLARHAVRVSPSGAAYANLGVVHLRLGDFPRALAACEEACRLAPESAEYLVTAAGCHRLLGNLTRAEELGRQALALDPESVYALVEMADIALEAGGPRSALPHLERALEIDGRSLVALRSRANALVWLGRYGEALAAIRRALELAAERGYDRTGEPWRGRLEVFRQVRDAWIAASPFENRVDEIASGKLVPGSPAQALAFGRACLFRGRAEAAAKYYGVALDGDPSELLELDNFVWAAGAGVATGTRAGRDRAREFLRRGLAALETELEEADLDRRIDIRDTLFLTRRHRLLKPVRAGLGTLPGEERESWLQLWRDLEALLARALETEGR